ncbi:MAG: hypothetical protein ACQERX_06375 [Bacillota bacterium]
MDYIIGMLIVLVIYYTIMYLAGRYKIVDKIFPWVVVGYLVIMLILEPQVYTQEVEAWRVIVPMFFGILGLIPYSVGKEKRKIPLLGSKKLWDNEEDERWNKL